MAQLAADGSTFDTSRGEWADTCNGITVLKKKKPFTFVLGQGIFCFPSCGMVLPAFEPSTE